MLIVAVAFAVTLTTGEPDTGTGFELGVSEIEGPLPELPGEVLGGGEPLSTDDLAGKVVVLNFWASWCAPCRLEQPELTAFHESHGEDVAIVGVNYRDYEAPALAYQAEFEVPYPSLVDYPGTLLGRLGIPGLPATVIAGPDGRLRFRVLGTVDAELLVDLVERARS